MCICVYMNIAIQRNLWKGKNQQPCRLLPAVADLLYEQMQTAAVRGNGNIRYRKKYIDRFMLYVCKVARLKSKVDIH